MSGGRLFTQVTRTKAATSTSDDPIFDPLSIFASEQTIQSAYDKVSYKKNSSILQESVLVNHESPAIRPISTETSVAVDFRLPPKVDTTNRIEKVSWNDSLGGKQIDTLIFPERSGDVDMLSHPTSDGQTFFNDSTKPVKNTQKTSSPSPAHKNYNIGEEFMHSKPVSPESAVVAEGEDDSDVKIRLLTGEQRVMSIIDAFLQTSQGKFTSGTLYMTNYRVAFVPSTADLAIIADSNPSVNSWLHIPLACIDRIEKERRDKQSTAGINIVISCKDFRQHRVNIRSRNNHANSEYELDQALGAMSAYAFPNNMRYLFAFAHSMPLTRSHDAVRKLVKFDLQAEYHRMGLLDSPMWRLSLANCDYKLCNTYPKHLYVPRSVSDEDLHSIANFRSGHRFPALCWANSETGATLWRSAQPKSGVSGSCLFDERLLEAIAATSCATLSPRASSSSIPSSALISAKAPLPLPPSSTVGNSPIPAPALHQPTSVSILHIADLRSRASAMANRAAGAGYESQANYPNSRLEFYNIPNIHVMRDSLKTLSSLLLNPAAPPANDIGFTKLIEDSQWLTYVRLVIKASWEVASLMLRSVPVLVHCSHGWDRTAQVCSTAEMFLDPYYRTIDGFRALVEKEWLSFGHPFQIRSAHGQDKAARQDDQVSPIFLQFLDTVWQIWKQSPQHFEFNSRYILCIADHIYSGRFGSFLFSNDYDRDMYGASENTVDIWLYLELNRKIFTNPMYIALNQPLLPPLSQLLRNVSIWSDYFLRWSSTLSIPTIPPYLDKCFQRNGLCVPVVDACPSLSLQEDNLTNSQQVVDPLTVEASGQAGMLNGADLDVFAMQCSNDFWEGAYRTEMAKRRQSQSPSSQELIFRSPYDNSRKSPNAQTTQYPNGGAHSSNSQAIAKLVELIRSKASSVISEEDLSSILGEITTSNSVSKTGSLDHNGSMGVGLDLELLDPEESKWIDALPSSDNNLRDDPVGISNLMDYYPPSTRSSSKQEIAEEENDSNNIFL